MAIYWAEAPRRALIAITAICTVCVMLRVFVCVRYPLVTEDTFRPFLTTWFEFAASSLRTKTSVRGLDPFSWGVQRSWSPRLERNHCSRILWTDSCVPVFCTGLEAVHGNSWQKPKFSTSLLNDLYFIAIFIQCTTNRRGSKINCWRAKVQKKCWQAYALLCN